MNFPCKENKIKKEKVRETYANENYIMIYKFTYLCMILNGSILRNPIVDAVTFCFEKNRVRKETHNLYTS